MTIYLADGNLKLIASCQEERKASEGALKCEVCNSDIDESAVSCPVCGTELDERLLPDIKGFLLGAARGLDKRVRIAALIALLLAISWYVYHLFPGSGTISGRITWYDGVNEYPVVGARILVQKDGEIVLDKVSDEKGRFALSAPAGWVEIVVADLASVKTGNPSDYTVTKRVWLARFWKKRLFVKRGAKITLNLSKNNSDPPEIKFFSSGQLTDYLNREGWTLNGPFSKEQIRSALAGR